MWSAGAGTITDGEICPMEPGDLILTPAWTWRNIAHSGASGSCGSTELDLPLAATRHHLRRARLAPRARARLARPRGLVAAADAALRKAACFERRRPGSPLLAAAPRYAWARVRRHSRRRRPFGGWLTDASAT